MGFLGFLIDLSFLRAITVKIIKMIIATNNKIAKTIKAIKVDWWLPDIDTRVCNVLIINVLPCV